MQALKHHKGVCLLLRRSGVFAPTSLRSVLVYTMQASGNVPSYDSIFRIICTINISPPSIRAISLKYSASKTRSTFLCPSTQSSYTVCQHNLPPNYIRTIQCSRHQHTKMNIEIFSNFSSLLHKLIIYTNNLTVIYLYRIPSFFHLLQRKTSIIPDKRP